jgi:hypothetical protein
VKKFVLGLPAFCVAAVTAVLVTSGSVAASTTVCPPGGLAYTTVSGGLLVNGGNYCTLDHVTVRGGVTVAGGSDVDLENATVNGGILIQPGGEIESDPGSVFFGSPAVSTVTGGIVLNQAVDWDIETTQITGGVNFNGFGGHHSDPTFCGNTVFGPVSIRDLLTPAAPTFFGDPADEFFECPGNTITGSLSIRNARTLEVEGNTVDGSVSVGASMLELNGNSVGGNLSCSRTTVILGGEPGDAAGNTVEGSNSC